MRDESTNKEQRSWKGNFKITYYGGPSSSVSQGEDSPDDGTSNALGNKDYYCWLVSNISDFWQSRSSSITRKFEEYVFKCFNERETEFKVFLY